MLPWCLLDCKQFYKDFDGIKLDMDDRDDIVNFLWKPNDESINAECNWKINLYWKSLLVADLLAVG